MIHKRQPAYVGILVHETQGNVPFSDRSYFSRLSTAGKRLGVNVYVFSTEWIDWGANRIRGYAYSEKRNGWTRRLFPFPALIYDRAFFRSRAEFLRHRKKLSRLLARPGVKLLGLGLTGKLDVHRMLAEDPMIARSLPPTEPYRSAATLSARLREYGEAILKPHGGTHGKGVFRILRIGPNEYQAVGRSWINQHVRRRFSSLRALTLWADSALIRGRRYLVQQYLPLTNKNGAPFDIRALVQKNGLGEWAVTGAAARIGPVGSVTSNLHGGGMAVPAKTFLIDEYGEVQAEDVLRTIQETSLAIPPVLEQRHGPLLELGIDFGVDRIGCVWVLEVNSKPGRSSFKTSKDKNVRIAAVTNPIRYARYVLNRQVGGQTNEFDVKQHSLYPKRR